MTFSIEEPQFLNTGNNKVKFTLITNGQKSQGFLDVPPKGEKGINKYWDYILDNFDIQVMASQARRAAQIKQQEELNKAKQEQYLKEKQKAEETKNKLKKLFERKTEILSYPFIKDMDLDIKSAIRRAPDLVLLEVIFNDVVLNFIKNSNMTYNEFFDYLEESEDESATE